MKPILRSLRGLAVVAALTSGLAVDAQTVQFFSLQKGQNFVQTDATTVTVMPLNPTFDLYPWRFESDINGTGLDASNPTPPNTVTTPTTPIASLVTSYNLTPPDVMGHGWQYRPGYSSQASMDADHQNGTYSVALANGTASTFTLNLSGDLYPNSPFATLTGGSWNAGTQRYDVDPGSVWTLSTGLYDTNFLWNYSRIEIDIWGGGVDFNKDVGAGSTTAFSSSATDGSLSLSSTELPTFIAGNTYVVDIRFARVIDFKDISAELGSLGPSAQGVSMYESLLSFSIQAIPEPSTYAVWTGVLALGLVAWRRRRAG